MKITPLLLFIFLLFETNQFSFGQLSAGDIAFVGFNSDDPDAFTFIALADISAGTEIYFTDNGWTALGEFRTGEGILKWTCPVGGLSAGDIINTTKDGTWIVSSGTVSAEGGSFSLSASGDQILAYQVNDPDTTFIAALHYARSTWNDDATSSNESAIPTGLTNFTNAMSFSHKDNGIFVGSLGGSHSELLLKINNPDNWYKEDNYRFSILSSDFPCNVFDHSVNNDWGTSGNWFTDTVPNGNFCVYIPTSTTPEIDITTEANCNKLTIESGGVLTIKSGSTNTGSLICNSVSGTGTANVERYIPSNNWHIISSPVSNQQLGSFVSSAGNSINEYTTDDYDLAPYNELTDGWTPYTAPGNPSTMEVAKGYVMHRTSTGVVTFSGTLNTGEPSIAITRSNFGWNAVGNPYSSTITGTGTGGFLTENSDQLDGSYTALYIWDEGENSGNGDYITYTNATTENIALGQGFIVKSKIDGGTVNFTSAMQVHSTGTTFKSAELLWPAIKLSVATANMINKTTVTFNNEMTNGLDPAYDAGKLKGNPDLSLYTKLLEGNDIDFAVQALSDNNFELYRIPVGLDCTTGGEITFTAETVNLPVGVQAILEDTETKSFTRLDLPSAKYTTTVNAGNKGTGRFYLLTSETMITESNDIQKRVFSVFTRNMTIIINGSTSPQTRFVLYSIDGKLWYNNKAENLNQNFINTTGFPAGVYFLRIINPGNIQSEKLILTQ